MGIYVITKIKHFIAFYITKQNQFYLYIQYKTYTEPIINKIK